MTHQSGSSKWHKPLVRNCCQWRAPSSNSTTAKEAATTHTIKYIMKQPQARKDGSRKSKMKILENTAPSNDGVPQQPAKTFLRAPGRAEQKKQGRSLKTTMISLKRATVQENTKPLSIQYFQLPFHRTTVSWRCERSLLAIESSSARRARLNGWRRRHLCWWHQRCNNNGFHMNGKGALFHKCEAACLRQWILIRHYGRKAHKIRQILLRSSDDNQ